MPFRRITISTTLPPLEAEGRLRTLIRPTRGLWESIRETPESLEDKPPLEGTVGSGKFKASRVIGYKNLFLPVLRGSIKPDVMGSRIIVIMSLHFFVAGFMIVVFGLLVFAQAQLLPDLFRAKNPVDLMPLGGIFVWLAIVCGSFYPEAWKAEKILRSALTAG